MADQHPPPWRWDEDPTGDPALRDANNDPVICVSQGQQWIASPRVHALTEAAPEMEALLRHLASGTPAMYNSTSSPAARASMRDQIDRLLARIDERSKGTT